MKPRQRGLRALTGVITPFAIQQLPKKIIDDFAGLPAAVLHVATVMSAGKRPLSYSRGPL